ncbi:helix-turn-helix domain-containing protein [Sediminibacterium sp.]|uniref:helix-turn-helix domain-containing protein n=1 Tax=Sediminibacterium sp. TaxID=1917865 RepID=UPI0025CF9AB4|nr:helix-turn-helix domain-containing protein [Sediminibacterium sp.]MBW0177631.1 helix-turn-helix domain-containing protein [Sediminibacterium sp.]
MKSNIYEKKREYNTLFFFREIYENSELTTCDMFLLMFVASLDKKDKCFASNAYLAKMLHMSTASVSRSINKLCRMGLIIENTNTGRSNLRRVKPTLKAYQTDCADSKSETSIVETTLINDIDQVGTNDMHIKEVKKELNKVSILSEEYEMDYCSKVFLFEIRNKESIYLECKKIFEAKYPVVWDVKEIESLILLCETIRKTYEKQINKCENTRDKKDLYIKLFESFLENIPNWIHDLLPSIFVRFIKKIISNTNYRKRVERILNKHFRTSYIKEGSDF